jgi:hypothetical protein
VYNPDLGRAVLTESTQDEADRAAEQSAAMVELALHQTREPWPEVVELADLDHEGFTAWITPIDAAKSRSLMLWSDDAVQRRLARHMGVEVFGTLTLLEHLTETRRSTLQQRQDALDELLLNGAADLPFDPSRWQRIAERDGWKPKAAALQLSRPHAWAKPVESLRLLDRALKQTNEDEDAFGTWVARGLLGLMRATIPTRRAENLGLIFGRLWSSNTDNAARFPMILNAARWVARQVDVEDPLPAAAILIHDMLAEQVGEAAAVAYVLRLAERAASSDRQLIAEAILRRPRE